MGALRRLLIIASALYVLGGALFAAAPAQASAVPQTKGELALDYAEAHYAGCWYFYGGTSCAPGFDCSGIVQAAVWHADRILLPRTTYGMLTDWRHLVRDYTPHRGDLAFYGTGHVEFMTRWWHTTWGEHDWGERAGYATWGGWWVPTAFYRLR